MRLPFGDTAAFDENPLLRTPARVATALAATNRERERTMTVQDNTDDRLSRLEDRVAIQELAVLYGLIMDERDEAGIRKIFCEDATLRSQDGVFAAHGMEEIVTTYLGRFAALGPTNHYSHGHLIRFTSDPDIARGLLESHAEVERNDTPMRVALRYKDIYKRIGGSWKFADRLMSYMYYMPFAELATDMGNRNSVRAYGDHRPSDWPEVLYSQTGNAFLAEYY
jgi:hypothetical protein